MTTSRFMLLAALMAASATLPAHAARAADVWVAPAWDVSEQKKPKPDKPRRPHPKPGPKDGGEDE